MVGKKAKGCEDRNRARWLIHPKPAPEQGRDSWEDAETLSCLPTTKQVIKAEVLFISEGKRGRPKRYLAATKLGKKRDVHHAAAVKNYTATRFLVAKTREMTRIRRISCAYRYCMVLVFGDRWCKTTEDGCRTAPIGKRRRRYRQDGLHGKIRKHKAIFTHRFEISRIP